MKVKRLFKDGPAEEFNDFGREVSDRVSKTLQPLFEWADKEGVAMRDLSYMIALDAHLMSSCRILCRYGSEKPLTKVRKKV